MGSGCHRPPGRLQGRGRIGPALLPARPLMPSPGCARLQAGCGPGLFLPSRGDPLLQYAPSVGLWGGQKDIKATQQLMSSGLALPRIPRHQCDLGPRGGMKRLHLRRPSSRDPAASPL